MRSTTRRRLAMCSCCGLITAQCSLPDTFTAWRVSKRFVVGGQLPSRSELLSGARALRRLVEASDASLLPRLPPASGVAN